MTSNRLKNYQNSRSLPITRGKERARLHDRVCLRVSFLLYESDGRRGIPRVFDDGMADPEPERGSGGGVPAGALGPPAVATADQDEVSHGPLLPETEEVKEIEGVPASEAAVDDQRVGPSRVPAHTG